jgi:hypothetical protein
MSKAQQVREYNEVNSAYSDKGYGITGIKELPKEYIQWMRVNAAKSLDELYASYSDIKRNSYREILDVYEPLEVIGLQGSWAQYSVTLKASNGDILWVTKCNNYLVKVV